MVAMGDAAYPSPDEHRPPDTQSQEKTNPPNGDLMKEYAESIELRDLRPTPTDSKSTTETESAVFESREVPRDPNHPVVRLQDNCLKFAELYGKYVWWTICFLCLIGYTLYLIAAAIYDVNGAMAFLVITGLVLACLLYAFIKDHFGETINRVVLDPFLRWWDDNFHIIKWFLYPGLIIALILYLTLDVIKEPKQLQSLSGIICFIAFTYCTSKYPDKVVWRPVLWGYSLQFIFAVIVLRWPPGYDAVAWLAEVITRFVNFAYEGAAVVFGDPWLLFHAFTFMGMPLLIYIGMWMAVLYYYGVTQWCAIKLGWFFMVTMGTTAIETLNVAANIFLNGMDTMLMLRPYLTRLTKSEFHCFLVGGHATVAGFAFALFVLFGAPPEHLLSAAVMSAPATIAIAKLNHPETEESITHKIEDITLARGDEANVFEAAANGAAIAGKTVAAVLVSYIAFLSLLAWVDSALNYIGTRVGYEDLSFALICSVLFWPIALLMGTDIDECLEVGKIVGIKVICSEILAFQVLGESIRAGELNARSEAIATYAICGFSSLSTLAIAVGVWHAICPSKVTEMSSQMARALTNANMSCFMTACIAGLMFVSEDGSSDQSPLQWLLSALGDAIPGYKDLMELVGL